MRDLWLCAGLDLAHHGKVHVDEFIAAALDQRKIMTSKTINTIFGEWFNETSDLRG